MYFFYNMKAFYSSLPDEIKARLFFKLRRSIVHLPHLSLWQKMFYTGDNPTLITATGFDKKEFKWILERFQDVCSETTVLGRYDYTIHPIQKIKGRPHLARFGQM
eukprot:9241209-Ditylum_brightwellii.AAC.1